MKPTKKSLKELHYRLWDWLYHHPSKGKKDWPEWDFNDGAVKSGNNYSLCFLCLWQEIRLERYTKMKHFCQGCPLDDDLNLFDSWSCAETPRERKKYAKLMRDVKW